MDVKTIIWNFCKYCVMSWLIDRSTLFDVAFFYSRNDKVKYEDLSHG